MLGVVRQALAEEGSLLSRPNVRHLLGPRPLVRRSVVGAVRKAVQGAAMLRWLSSRRLQRRGRSMSEDYLGRGCPRAGSPVPRALRPVLTRCPILERWVHWWERWPIPRRRPTRGCRVIPGFWASPED